MLKIYSIVIIIMFGLFTSANGSYEKRAYDFSFKDLDGS